PEELSILPIKNTVLFPGVVLPITVGRQKSIRLVKKAYQGNRIIGVVAQKNSQAEEPLTEERYRVGTIARIIKMLVLPDGNPTITIQGHERFSISAYLRHDPSAAARLTRLTAARRNMNSRQVKALIQSLKEAASMILRLNPEIPQEAQVALDNHPSMPFRSH